MDKVELSVEAPAGQTLERLKRGIWNPEERQVLVPKVYGWGYEINLYEIARRLRVVRHRRSGEQTFRVFGQAKFAEFYFHALR
jgi:hypothetical protein